MKNIYIIFLILLSIGSASCKKDYNCECRKNYYSSNVSDGIYTYHDSRPKAESKCNSQERAGSDLAGDYSRECFIK